MLYMCENCKINDTLRTLYVFIAILGVHHQVSILAMYLNIVLGQTAVAVLLSVWILNLHFRDDNKPPSKRMRNAALRNAASGHVQTEKEVGKLCR